MNFTYLCQNYQKDVTELLSGSLSMNCLFFLNQKSELLDIALYRQKEASPSIFLLDFYIDKRKHHPTYISSMEYTKEKSTPILPLCNTRL
jgi:hypothetical protein